MYISSYISMPPVLFSFMVGYEVFRKDFVSKSLWTRSFALMVISVVLMMLIGVVNRNVTVYSLPMFVGSVICAVWGVYMLLTRPAKLPEPPSLD